MNDIMSDVGLKNCSMLVLENNIDNDPYEKSDDEHESSKRNTVEQFLEEEPPALQLNQKCLEHPNEFVVAYDKLTF